MLMIFDLDGTILSINSFRPWALYMVKARFPHLTAFQRLSVSTRAAATLAARKVGLMSHDACKWRLQRLWQEATEGDGGRSAVALSRELMTFVRPEMHDVLSLVSAGRVEAVMATAAAGEYAYCLGRMLGFSNVVATPAGRSPGEPENVGRRKREAVAKLIAERRWERHARILFTDHVDDMPLIELCENVFWFGSETHRRYVSHAIPGVRFLMRPAAAMAGAGHTV